ncbi:MAG: division/cell wall cluster transcriptional repressor MraZ [Candidatus Methylomirabilia bacterium]
MFRGRFHHTIDPKGRLSIPAKFREALLQHFGENLIVVPNEHCLEVHPLEEWQRVEEKVRQLPTFSPERKAIARLFTSKGREATLDGQGRILLPPDVRTEAGLAKDVTIVGGGLPVFEVWDRLRFEEFDRTHQDEIPTVLEKLAAMGI